jgi:hypothetical protein
VLADHILAKACLTPRGAATGFADRVFAEFAADCLAQLLRNLAELDWRIRVDSGDESPLLDRVWHQISEGFRACGHHGRTEILGRLRDSAYFLPSRVLELVRYALCNPAPDGPAEVAPGYLSYTHQNVMRAAPELLLRCAYSPDCLSGCLELLWELDQHDDRAPNSNPDHPFRIITDIAACQPGKPLWVSQTVSEAARRWLSRPGAWDRRHTPLDVLAPLLEKAGIAHEADSHQIQMRPFHLLYESVRGLREGVLGAIEECLRSPNLRAVLKGVETLRAGLKGPMPYLGMTFTEGNLRQWEPEQLSILGLLARLVEQNPPPVVSLAVLREVRHQARHGHLEAVRVRAGALVRSIDQSFDFRLTRMLLPEMSRWDLFEEDASPDPVVGREERHRALARSVAGEFWERYPDPTAAVLEVDRRVREILPLEPKCDASSMVWWLFETKPDAVPPFVRQLLSLPESPVANCLDMGLAHLHRSEPATAVDLASQALETGAAVFRQRLAHHFAWNLRGQTPLHEEEVALIRRLLADPDLSIRATAVGALRRLGAFRPRDALDLALGVDVGSDSPIVVELCRLADPHWEGRQDAFTDGDIVAFLERIEVVDELGYDTAQFLKFACERTPLAVVEMLFRRIERQEEHGYRFGYKPVPFNALHDTFSGLVGTHRHREVLCRVCDYSLGRRSLALDSLAELYRDVSQRYGPVGIEVLADWLLNGSPAQMEAAAGLLNKAPNSFVFGHLELVSRALDRAEGFGDDCFRRVGGIFYSIATSGMRSGPSGQPFPQDIALRKRCQELLSTLPAGSSVFRLVRDVLRTVERDIQAATQDDDE